MRLVRRQLRCQWQVGIVLTNEDTRFWAEFAPDVLRLVRGGGMPYHRTQQSRAPQPGKEQRLLAAFQLERARTQLTPRSDNEAYPRVYRNKRQNRERILRTEEAVEINSSRVRLQACTQGAEPRPHASVHISHHGLAHAVPRAGVLHQPICLAQVVVRRQDIRFVVLRRRTKHCGDSANRPTAEIRRRETRRYDQQSHRRIPRRWWWVVAIDRMKFTTRREESPMA